MTHDIRAVLAEARKFVEIISSGISIVPSAEAAIGAKALLAKIDAALTAPETVVDEKAMREILAEECDRCGYGFAAKVSRDADLQSHWINVALAAMSRVARALRRSGGNERAMTNPQATEARIAEELASALIRTQRAFEHAVRGTPVRDMAETLAEGNTALARYDALKSAPAPQAVTREEMVEIVQRAFESDDTHCPHERCLAKIAITALESAGAIRKGE